MIVINESNELSVNHFFSIRNPIYSKDNVAVAPYDTTINPAYQIVSDSVAGSVNTSTTPALYDYATIGDAPTSIDTNADAKKTTADNSYQAIGNGQFIGSSSGDYETCDNVAPSNTGGNPLINHYDTVGNPFVLHYDTPSGMVVQENSTASEKIGTESSS